MPTSTILRLLAELVRSYVGIAALIANYSYSVGQSELIKEDCSVLAFVLDHLLPHQQNAEDKDTPALARLFLASLAAAGSGTDAQVALVNEVKAALGRALAMAESTEKHARLQAVMCIISTIMESCPSTSSFYSSAAKAPHNGMNNIIRLFLKKGLVNDLARVTPDHQSDPLTIRVTPDHQSDPLTIRVTPWTSGTSHDIGVTPWPPR
ncbi:PREDICTED: E3 ubiquitin-protein ligase HUWE1-like [Sturnus vulgaris]|uniref:E3 ubiquitin-protein ligase HUWE1-like n=1 Tax=Sturnus vulgaris TaxID=9172 RepID=UPI00071A1C4F|nr:PREDICTED: E3 ubiquitin-protein ligase HUWE1-like [Sturnus vulgaris]